MRSWVCGISSAIALVLFSSPSQAWVQCGEKQSVLELNNLYFLDARNACWQRVKPTGFEGTLIGSIGKLPAYNSQNSGSARFMFVVTPVSANSTPVEKKTIVVKQRVFISKSGRPPTQEVILDRSPITNNGPCKPKGALRTKNGKAAVNLTAYNRYHGQIFNFIPATDELRDFHYDTPTTAGCLATDSPATRGRYVFSAIESAVPSVPVVSSIANLFVSAISNAITSAVANTITTVPFTNNTAYAELKVSHFVVDGSKTEVDSTHARYAVAFFDARSEKGVDIEINVAPLIPELVTLQQTVWQLEWK